MAVSCSGSGLGAVSGAVLGLREFTLPSSWIVVFGIILRWFE